MIELVFHYPNGSLVNFPYNYYNPILCVCFKVSQTKAQLCEDKSQLQSLQDLINDYGCSRTWNLPMVESTLNAEDRSLLQKLYLPQCKKQDRQIWCYDKPGEYTVKSGYWLAFREHIQDHPDIIIPHGDPVLKDQIWRLQIMPKIKHFFWRALSKALPTATRLVTRGMKIDKFCQRCCLEHETINHTLFSCLHSQSFWRMSQLPWQPLNLHDDNCDDQVSRFLELQNIRGLSDYQKLFPFWLVWQIWKSRCNLIFKKQTTLPQVIVQQAHIDVMEWLNSRSLGTTCTSEKRDLGVSSSSRNLSWLRPSLGYFKCNFDASYDLHSQQSKAGWIIRDHNGVAYSWGTTILGFSNSSLEAEANALLIAMQQTWSLGLDFVVFEGDCKVLIDYLQGNHIDFNIENIRWDISKWRRDFKNCDFVYTRRNNNTVAHALASNVPDNGLFYSSRLNPPLWLSQLLDNDFVIDP